MLVLTAGTLVASAQVRERLRFVVVKYVDLARVFTHVTRDLQRADGRSCHDRDAAKIGHDLRELSRGVCRHPWRWRYLLIGRWMMRVLTGGPPKSASICGPPTRRSLS